jgi:hypothetical protein
MGIFALLFLTFTIQPLLAQDNFRNDFSNPAFFCGSDLPHFYQRLWINGHYDTMLKFTSSMSRKKYGDERITEYFKRMEFGYNLKLKSRTFGNEGIQVLNCVSKQNATDLVVRFRCVIESDTAKILIDDIENVRFP